MSDIIVDGVSGVGQSRVGRKEEKVVGEGRVHARPDARGGESAGCTCSTATTTTTTIQFGALHRRHVTISRLRATCLAGDAMLGNCLRLRRGENAASARERVRTRAKVKGGWFGRRGGRGWLREKGRRREEVADRRVLGRIFCIWICRICQIFLRRDASPSLPFLL